MTALRRTAVDHNIRLMHRLGHEQLFGNTLEAARGEKNPARLQAYVSIFEEYFTYWNASQKQQTLDFLYELLLIPDGDIRRRAAALIGRILACLLYTSRLSFPLIFSTVRRISSSIRNRLLSSSIHT